MLAVGRSGRAPVGDDQEDLVAGVCPGVRRLGDTVSVLNLPAGHPASSALAALGGTANVRQYEMVLQL